MIKEMIVEYAGARARGENQEREKGCSMRSVGASETSVCTGYGHRERMLVFWKAYRGNVRFRKSSMQVAASEERVGHAVAYTLNSQKEGAAQRFSASLIVVRADDRIYVHYRHKLNSKLCLLVYNIYIYAFFVYTCAGL